MKKQTIVDAIEKVKPALADGKLIEFAGILLFDGKKLVSYGDEISVSVPLETNFVTAVKSDEFSKLIQKIPWDEFEIVIDDNQLVITAEGMKAGFSTVEYDESAVPDWGIEQIKKWTKLPENFMGNLRFCTFSASSDPAYGVLCNVKVEEGRLLSSDNFRITESRLIKKLAKMKQPLLIPRKIALFLSTFKLTGFAVTDACAHYQDASGAVFSHKLIAEEYPDVDAHLEIQGSELKLPKELANVLARANIIVSAEGAADQVAVSIEKDRILIRGDGIDSWIEEPIQHKYKGDDLHFTASPEHLIQIMGYSNEVIIGENAILFSGENFRHAVCLFDQEEEEKK